jgi:uncharacterized membrane protein
MTAMLWLRMLHFTGFVLLVSGLVCMSMMLRAGAAKSAKPAGILADIGGTLVLATGIYNALKTSLFSQPWLHMKLALVAGLIGVQIALRVKIRKDTRGGAGALLLVTLILVAGILLTVIMRPLAR